MHAAAHVKIESMEPTPSPGTPIWVHLTYCDDCVLLDAFELKSDTRWSFLHGNYADACWHAERLGLANGRMRNIHLGPMNPYFWFEILVNRPGETFKEFFQTKPGPYQ